MGTAAYDYEAFISYSHAADGKLAPAVQTALERFGTPWYRRSGVRIFRDQTGLGLTPDLWADIQQRLERARCFILLAAPEAARSEWVEKEILFWVQHRAGDPMMIVLTGGTLDWNELQNDFDWTRTDALPRSLHKVFQHEPLWADLTWAREDADLSLKKPRFFVEIAKIVAGVRGLPLDKVFDEAAVQQQKAMRLFRAATAALIVATVLALGAAIVGLRQWRTVRTLNDVQARRIQEERKQEEERQRELVLLEKRRTAESTSAQLAAKATALWPSDRELSTLLAVQAVTTAPTPEAERALRQTLLDPVEPLVLRGHSGPVQAEFCADGTRVLTTSSDRTVRLWDSQTGKSLRTFRVGGDQYAYVMGFASADGARVLTMAGPDTFALGHWQSSTPLEVHDTATGELLTTITDRFAARADLSSDGSKIVTAGFDASARIRDAGSGKVLFELRGHEHRVTSARFSSDGKWAVTCSYDGTARVWDANTGESMAILRASEDLVFADALFSPDGERIVTLGGATIEEDDVLQLWDWVHVPGASIATFRGHDGPINAVGFSRDGKRVVTGGTQDQSARIWDAATGQCLHVLSGFEGSVNAVAVSPNGKWLVTAGDDGTAQIWDAATGETMMPLGRDEYARTSASFSPDGERIVTGTSNGEVLLYSLPVLGSAEQLKALAQKRVTRALTPEERQKYLGETGNSP